MSIPLFINSECILCGQIIEEKLSALRQKGINWVEKIVKNEMMVRKLTSIYVLVPQYKKVVT